MYTYTHTTYHPCVCIHVYIFIHVLVNMDMHAYTNTCTYGHTFVYIFLCMWMQFFYIHVSKNDNLPVVADEIDVQLSLAASVIFEMPPSKMLDIIMHVRQATPERERSTTHTLALNPVQQARLMSTGSDRAPPHKVLSKICKKTGREAYIAGWEACKKKCKDMLDRVITSQAPHPLSEVDLEHELGEAEIPEKYMDATGEQAQSQEENDDQ